MKNLSKSHIKNISSGVSKYMIKYRKDKTLEQIYGKDKALKICSKHSNSLSGKKNPNFRGGKRVFVEKQYKDTAKYCSIGCKNKDHSKRMSGENHPFFNGWISREPYGKDWSPELKTSIRKRDKFVCQLCGKHGHYVHHIDYNKRHNTIDNLVTLCHSKTNANRDYWYAYFIYTLEIK